MIERYYTGGKSKIEKLDIDDLPPSPRKTLNSTSGYRPSRELVDAVNVALILRQPLLLTGEPGTGKTLLAYHVAQELQLGAPLKYEVRSTTSSSQFFYTFDELSRFRDAQRGTGSQSAPLDGASIIVENDVTEDPSKYITFQAFGAAILLSKEKKHPDVRDFWSQVSDKLLPKNSSDKERSFDGPRRSVVLIDEIDKAPRDVPNDLLNEIEHSYFRISEDGNRRIDSNHGFEPIVIITSNSERNLPDAFLRRCVYFNIDFPIGETMRMIVAERITGCNEDSALVTETVEQIESIRSLNLVKKPGTGEFLYWLYLLKEMGIDCETTLLSADDDTKRNVIQSTCVLAKTSEDITSVKNHFANWLKPADTPQE